LDISRYARADLDGEATYDRYEAIFEGIEAPFAFVDLDALEANAAEMLGRAGGKPIRVASKSVRCCEVMRRIEAIDSQFQGLLCLTLPEALHLSAEGFRDLVVAYPTVDRKAISALGQLAAGASDTAAVPTLMVDDPAQLDVIESAAGSGSSVRIKVAIDVDAGFHTARGLVQIGPKRSPIRTPEQARKLAEEIVSRPRLELDGLMAYEGQIAGVGDATPGGGLRNKAIRSMQARSAAELRERRAAVVAAVESVAPLRFVNGGGTGRRETTAADPSVTEVAAGSGFSLTPAAFFTLPVVRRAAPGSVTALGGGYVASGAPSADRLPVPYLPEGLHLDKNEGAGEAQTPLLGEASLRLRVGDRVYMRHSKAGELCERFNSLYLIRGDGIEAEAPTYRGEGFAFL
jgi:D-serine deaminase-like pyridoxal phosphate-dependent protein